MQAIILAGGEGTRIRALDAAVCKPMLPLFDRPIIEHTIEMLAKSRIREIVIASSAQTAELAEHLGDGSGMGVKLKYSIEEKPLGTAGAVKLAAQMVKGTFVVVSADVVTDCDLQAAIKSHNHSGAAATVLTATSDDPGEYGVVECDAAGRIKRVVEKPNSSDIFSDEVSSGIYILEPEVMSAIPPYRSSEFGSEVLPRVIANGDPVHSFHIPGYWRDVNSLLQSRNAHFDALSGRLKIEMPAQEVGSGVWMGERVEVDATVELIAPVYLGAGVRLRQGASVGPRAIIGSNTAVEQNARVSNSVIGGGSLISRHSTVKNCVIGPGCSSADGEEMDSLTVFEYANYQKRAQGKAEVRTPRIEVHSSGPTQSLIRQMKQG